MPTPAEKRALVFLAALAALGVVARGFAGRDRGGGATAATAAALDRQIGAVDAARAAAGTGSRRPTRDGKAGKASAPTGGPADGGRAPGSARRRPEVPWAGGGGVAGPAAPAESPLARYEARRLEVERSNAEARARVAERAADLARGQRASPGIAPPAPAGRTVPASAPARPPPARVDVDTAGPDALQSIPGIGPALAERIVEDRRIRGPFGSLRGLQRVRGIGPSLANRIASHVTFSKQAVAPAIIVQPGRPPASRRRP